VKFEEGPQERRDHGGLIPDVATGIKPEPQLAFHETMEIHELLNFHTVCMVKSKLASGLVFDQDLKRLLEKSVKQSMAAVSQLTSLYQASPQLQ
jgi:similar to spore coat protein